MSRVKVSQEVCAKCKYSMNMSSGTYYGEKMKACDYLGRAGESRVFRLGKHKPDYEPGYCNYFEKKGK